MPKTNPHHDRAVAIFDGTAQRHDDPPRTRESIIREIERALEQAFEAGVKHAQDQAQYDALMKLRAITRGYQQALTYHSIELERDLDALDERQGKKRVRL